MCHIIATMSEIYDKRKLRKCCICTGKQQNCVNCQCVKKGIGCTNCNKGENCQNRGPFNNTSNQKSVKNRDSKYDTGVEDKIYAGNDLNDMLTEEKPKCKRKISILKSSDVLGDGNCLFRCLSLEIFKTQDKHTKVREEVVEALRENEGFFKSYIGDQYELHLERMAKDGVWGTDSEILAASEKYKCDIFVYTKHGDGNKWLRYSTRQCNGNHKENYITLICENDHFKLAHVNERPCFCEQCEAEEEIVIHDTKDTAETSTKIFERNCHEINELTDKIYNHIISFKHRNMFELPQNNTTDHFMKEMTKLLSHYNSDSSIKKQALKLLMILPCLLLQKVHSKAKTRENNNALRRRLDLWKQGKLEDLLSEAMAIQERLSDAHPQNGRAFDKARLFRQKMENGHIRPAARLLEKRESTEILPSTKETLEKIKEKYPPPSTATKEALLDGERKHPHPVIFSAITGDMVRKAAIETKGAAGPSGMDANAWRKLLTSRKFPSSSSDLRDAIALLARKMCTEDCQHLEPLINSRLLPLNNHGKVRPIGIGEVLRRIIAKCVMMIAKEDVQNAVGNLQVCAGQHAGAEAAIHAMREVYNNEECEAVLLVDASNAFNTLNRQAMMHNVGILCPTLRSFVENTYKKPTDLFLSKGLKIVSEEGTTQGDPIAMSVYALSLVALQKKIDFQKTGTKHVAYADDFIGAGRIEDLKKWWDLIRRHGPPLGYTPNPEKSVLVVKKDAKELADQIFGGSNIPINTEGAKHLGAIIGSPEFKKSHIENIIAQWENELLNLTEIAKSEPQAAYSNFIYSVRQSWNFAMRTMEGLENYLTPLEEAISKKFLPTLLGCQVSPIYRKLMALPPKLGGMGIINPTKAAPEEFKNSVKMTKHLKKLIIEQNKYGDIDKNAVKDIRRTISKEREKNQKEELQRILDNQLQLPEKKKIQMCLEKGASNWLTALPLKDAGFSLNKLEFRDGILLRYGINISGLPDCCACGEEFTCDHAMICKTGGFVSLRHNELRDITGKLMSEVCKNVETEPQLQPLTGEKLRYETSNREKMLDWT